MLRHRILIVDDDRLLCDLVATMLRADGHEPVTAADGVHALAALRGGRTDLVILDANMPVMDGFAVLGALKADPMLADIPVLMLTGLRSEADVTRARQLGASAYVVKPFTTPTLLKRAYALIRANLTKTAPGSRRTTETVVARLDSCEWID